MNTSAATPATTLDRRFSDAAAEPVSWPDTVELLRSAEICWLGTVRADGRPHVTPVVAAWGDGGIHFATGAEEQKYLNLRTNPHVVITTGCNAWDRGRDVVVEGPAAQITDKAALERLAPLWADKWDGRWRFTAAEGGFLSGPDQQPPTPVFSVRPTKIYVHARDPFGATTHRF